MAGERVGVDVVIMPQWSLKAAWLSVAFIYGCQWLTGGKYTSITTDHKSPCSELYTARIYNNFAAHSFPSR